MRSVDGKEPCKPYDSPKPMVDAESLDSSSAKPWKELLRPNFVRVVRVTGGSEVRSQLVGSLSEDESDAMEAVSREGGKILSLR